MRSQNILGLSLIFLLISCGSGKFHKKKYLNLKKHETSKEENFSEEEGYGTDGSTIYPYEETASEEHQVVSNSEESDELAEETPSTSTEVEENTVSNGAVDHTISNNPKDSDVIGNKLKPEESNDVLRNNDDPSERKQSLETLVILMLVLGTFFGIAMILSFVIAWLILDLTTLGLAGVIAFGILGMLAGVLAFIFAMQLRKLPFEERDRKSKVITIFGIAAGWAIFGIVGINFLNLLVQMLFW